MPLKLAKRIKRIRAHSSLNQREFSALIGEKHGRLASVEVGKSVPRMDFISNVLTRFPELSARWLILGEGEMWEGATAPPQVVEDAQSGDSLPQATHLRSLVDLAQQGGSLGAYQLWRELAERHPKSVTTEELALATGLTASEVKAGLAVLRAYDLLEEDKDGICFAIGVLRTVEPISTAEHILEAIRLILKTIAPKLTRGNHTGRLATATFPVKSAESAIEALTNAVRAAYDEQLDENGQDTIVLTLGVADATVKLGEDG